MTMRATCVLTWGVGIFWLIGCGSQTRPEQTGQLTQRVELHDWNDAYGFSFIPPAPLSPGETLSKLRARLEKQSFPVQATGALHAPYIDSTGTQIVQVGAPVRFTCGATLISPSYFVTAAHCV